MLIDEATKRPVARPQPDETLETALKRIRFTPTPKQPAQRPSAYFTETGAPEFKEGAPIVPRVLAIAETTSPAARRDRVRVTTRKSSKPRTIEFPKHWLIDLFSSSTVPSFAARSRKAIIPMDGDGNLPLQDITEEDWLLPNDLYTGLARKPPSLLRQLGNRRTLTAQLPLRRGTRRNLVLCPVSGDIMRAVRTHVGSAVVDDTLCWYQARTSAEAAYLTVLLNTSCLQHAFTSANFGLHPWHVVPIPRYDETNPLHREIAALCTQAEKVAVRTVATELEADPGREQVSLSKAVRNALANDGIAATMDGWARCLLPDQAD